MNQSSIPSEPIGNDAIVNLEERCTHLLSLSAPWYGVVPRIIHEAS